MPKPRQDFAIVEFDFIRFDKRYRDLPPDEGQAFLHLWVTCVHLRRSRFTRKEIAGGWLADIAGVNAECLRSAVASGVASGLLSRGPGGTITVDGSRTKHHTLRTWND